MEQQEVVGDLSKPAAVAACTAMAVFYVAILYSPTLILRLPPPDSFKSFMIRRFVCAAISSVVSVIVCFLILPAKKENLSEPSIPSKSRISSEVNFRDYFDDVCPRVESYVLLLTLMICLTRYLSLMQIRGWDASNLLGVYGIRTDHIWQALVYPLSLTSCMYTGSFAVKLLSMFEERNEHLNSGGNLSAACIKSIFMRIIDWVVSVTSSVSSWRNYFVAPLTEELVFRACMIPLLFCGGFNTYGVIFLCPIFFSLAHLNHLLELYLQQNCSLLKACQVVGFQLGYTVIFGAYASFLFVRTGHLAAPLLAHMFCNFMGLPAIFSRSSGIIISLAFVFGMVSFLWMLFPLTSPHLYNNTTDNCRCWHRYCNWS